MRRRRLAKRTYTVVITSWRVYQLIGLVASILAFITAGSIATGQPPWTVLGGFFGSYIPRLDASGPVVGLIIFAIAVTIGAYLFLRLAKILIPLTMFIVGVGIYFQLLTIPEIILKYLPAHSQQQFLYAGAVLGLGGFVLLMMEYRS